MAKPVKLPKYLQGKNPKPLIEVFKESVRLKGEKIANLAPNKMEGPY